MRPDRRPLLAPGGPGRDPSHSPQRPDAHHSRPTTRTRALILAHPAASGIDDTRNIARIAIQMARDGCRMYLNEALPARRQAGNVAAFAASQLKLTPVRTHGRAK